MTRPGAFITRPVAQRAIERIAAIADVTVNPDSSRILPKADLGLKAASDVETGKKGRKKCKTRNWVSLLLPSPG